MPHAASRRPGDVNDGYKADISRGERIERVPRAGKSGRLVSRALRAMNAGQLLSARRNAHSRNIKGQRIPAPHIGEKVT